MKYTERDENMLCVVESAYDNFVFEKTNSFRGKYHVLDGALSPLDGIGPDELNINSLVERVDSGMEIIIATNPSVEGETTALYIAKILADKNVTLSKLARVVPFGVDMDYVYEANLIISLLIIFLKILVTRNTQRELTIKNLLILQF